MRVFINARFFFFFQLLLRRVSARVRLFLLHTLSLLIARKRRIEIEREGLGAPEFQRPNSGYLEELQLFSWACFPDFPGYIYKLA